MVSLMGKVNKMLAFKGIYDGVSVKLLESPVDKKRYKVIVTFIEELDSEEEIREFASQTDTFDFWKCEEEDLYQDYLEKLK